VEVLDEIAVNLRIVGEDPNAIGVAKNVIDRLDGFDAIIAIAASVFGQASGWRADRDHRTD
jgi:hypothetical protein